MANPYEPSEVNRSGKTKTKPIDPKDFNEWTILIYHSGESGLSEELIWSLKEMVHAGTSDRVEK